VRRWRSINHSSLVTGFDHGEALKAWTRTLIALPRWRITAGRFYPDHEFYIRLRAGLPIDRMPGFAAEEGEARLEVRHS
jgi:hypothetical protein